MRSKQIFANQPVPQLVTI